MPWEWEQVELFASPYEWYSLYQTQQSLRGNNQQLKSVLSVLTPADLNGDTFATESLNNGDFPSGVRKRRTSDNDGQ